tara:strand:+ start:3546 stop:3725 length:180 start_codon:yes stop_codon:yes gene_type:complete
VQRSKKSGSFSVRADQNILMNRIQAPDHNKPNKTTLISIAMASANDVRGMYYESPFSKG